MALVKEIVLENGVNTNYHVIQSVAFNFIENQTVIEVSNYVSKEIRDKLNELDEIHNSLDVFIKQYEEAEAKNDMELVASLDAKIHQLEDKIDSLVSKNYKAGSERILLNNIPNKISYSDTYTLLKTTDKYSKAKKV